MKLILSTLMLSTTAAFASVSVPTMPFRLDWDESYRAPAGVALGIASPIFSSDGDILLRYVVLEGKERWGLMAWHQAEQKMYTRDADPAIAVTDTIRCGDSGRYVYQALDGNASSLGVFAVDAKLQNQVRLVAPGKLASLEPVACSESAGVVVLRTKAEDSEATELQLLTGAFSDAAKLAPLNLGSLVSDSQRVGYVFKPDAKFGADGKLQLAFKYRYSADGKDLSDGAPDGIALYRVDLAGGSAAATFVKKVEDRDSAVGTRNFEGFDNAIRVNARGDVVFTAKLLEGARQLRYLAHDAGESVVIATEFERPEIDEISYFAPAISDDGRVAFRTSEKQNNKDFIWSWRAGQAAEYVVKSADDIIADLGEMIVGQAPDSGMSFYTTPEFNAKGELLVGALVDKPTRFGGYANRGLGFFVFNFDSK